MNLPRFCFALMAFALLCGVAPRPQAQVLDAKAVKEAIEQYVDADTAEGKRASLLATLGKAKNADVSAGLKSQIRKEATRALALELALALHARGQFATFEKYFDEHPQQITQLGLITADKGATKALHKRWAAAEIGSDTFNILNDAFLAHGADWDVLSEFQKVSVDAEIVEEKRAEAGNILKFQLGLETADPTEISLLWPELKKQFTDHGERPALQGMDWLAVPGWQLQGARRYGPNIRLVAEGQRFGLVRKTEGIPESIKSLGYTVSVRVRLDAGFEGDVGLLLTTGAQTALSGLHVVDGVWQVPGRDEGTNAAIKPGVWVTVALTITTVTEAGSLNIACSIDGKPVVKVAIVKGTPVGFCLQCSKGGSTWGNIDYTRN